MKDAINPSHYKIANNVQLIELIRLMPFSIGNAIKYCYRNGDKENAVQDLTKALWYLKDYKNNPLVIPIDIEQLNQLAIIVFDGLPEWEKNICFCLTRYFIEVTSSKGSELSESKYDEILHLIGERISQLKG